MIAACACVVSGCHLGSDISTRPLADFAPPSDNQIREWLGADPVLVCDDHNGIQLLDLEHQRRLPLLYLKSVSIYYALVVPGSQTQVLVFGSERSSETWGYWPYSLECPSQGKFIAECYRSGGPSLSPDGQSVAWIGARREDAHTVPGGVRFDKTSLHIGQLPDFVPLRCFSGDFDINAQGPAWIGASDGTHKFLVGMASGEIALFNPQTQDSSVVCVGKLPAVIPGTEDFVFIRDKRLFLRSGTSERQITQFQEAAPSDCSLKVSPDGKTAVYTDWVDCPVGFGFVYKIPGLVVIDLATGKRRDLHLSHPRGPWQFLDGRRWLSRLDQAIE